MAITQVQIWNMALGMIGGNRVASADDGSTEARACLTIYETLRDEVLEAFPWTFAAARASLAMDSAAPDFGFSYAYVLPSDFLAPRGLDDDSIKYVIEGNKLLTDAEAVNLRYTKKVTAPGLFSPSFAAILAARMAPDLAMIVVKSVKLSSALFDIYEKRLKGLQLTNARYDTADPESSSPYVEARD